MRDKVMRILSIMYVDKPDINLENLYLSVMRNAPSEGLNFATEESLARHIIALEESKNLLKDSSDEKSEGKEKIAFNAVESMFGVKLSPYSMLEGCKFSGSNMDGELVNDLLEKIHGISLDRQDIEHINSIEWTSLPSSDIFRKVEDSIECAHYAQSKFKNLLNIRLANLFIFSLEEIFDFKASLKLFQFRETRYTGRIKEYLYRAHGILVEENELREIGLRISYAARVTQEEVTSLVREYFRKVTIPTSGEQHTGEGIRILKAIANAFWMPANLLKLDDAEGKILAGELDLVNYVKKYLNLNISSKEAATLLVMKVGGYPEENGRDLTQHCLLINRRTNRKSYDFFKEERLLYLLMSMLHPDYYKQDSSRWGIKLDILESIEEFIAHYAETHGSQQISARELKLLVDRCLEEEDFDQIYILVNKWKYTEKML